MTARPLDVFCSPLPLAAVALLALNDHALKGSGLAPAWFTGKLSDFAGLFFFPLLLAAAASLIAAPGREGRILLGCAAATAAVFCAVKISPDAGALYELAVGWLRGSPARNTCDPTDLVALPMCAAAVLYAGRAKDLQGGSP